MSKAPLINALIAAALLLAGCASTYVSPVEVTRFVGESPQRLGSGTIAVRAAPGMPDDRLEFAIYEQAIGAELARLGYQVVTGPAAASAEQIAEVRVSRLTQRAASTSRSPVSVGVGGSTGSYGSGLGVGLGINLGGGGRPSEVVDTAIGVVIRDATGALPLWEGRAGFSASARSDQAARDAAAERLASALFSGFPGQSGETIEVR